jgi:hypothetical protein
VDISNVTFVGRYLLTDGSSLSAGYAMYNFDSDIPLSVYFADGARAFGADFSSMLSPTYPSFTATLSLNNGEILTFVAATNPNSTFFGFISPTPITHLTFSDGGLFGFSNLHQELIANLYMVTSVPEPSSLALLGCGAVLFAVHLLRRFRRPKC